jgi:hypothetical protein
MLSGGLIEDGVLATGNFNGDIDNNIANMVAKQPMRPLMVMEYYPGWLDHWFEVHQTVPAQRKILSHEQSYA